MILSEALVLKTPGVQADKLGDGSFGAVRMVYDDDGGSVIHRTEFYLHKRSTRCMGT